MILALAMSVCLTACIAPVLRSPVEHDLAENFWRNPPVCVVVVPAVVAGEVPHRLAERALARHLFGRVAVVVGPDRRDAEARHLALDLTHPEDRARYGALAGCRHGAELELVGGRSYAVIWAEAAFDLKARLIDLATGDIVWSARHRASRSNGGLPISPVGLVVAAGQAGAFVADGDLLPSVLEDGLRALMATLPAGDY